MTNTQILLAILTFVALTFGTFIWFVATWDADKEPSLSFILDKKLPPEASDVLQNIRIYQNERAVL